MIKKLLSALMLVSAPLGASAESEAYCSGPVCSDATQINATSAVPAPVAYKFYLAFMLNDYARKYPEHSVSQNLFSPGVVMELDTHDAVNLLLFYDPLTLNLGLEPSDFVPGIEAPSSGSSGTDSGANGEPFDFRFMTTGDYVGHLDGMLDELIVRYPDQTVTAEDLPSSGTVSLQMYQVAQILIALDPHLESLGWSPSVFE